MNWHSKSVEQALQELEVSRKGLTKEEAAQRKEKYGPNILRQDKGKSLWSILFAQLKSPVVYLLVGAAGISFAFGNNTESIAILIVIVINTAIGFIMEKQAIQSMQALKKLDKVTARVMRNEKPQQIDSKELVPGDVLLVEGGDVISADARIMEATQLEVDESALTGESLPATKHADPVEEETPLADRDNMLYKGTAITRGNGKALIIGTGMETELGTISGLVQAAEKEEIPLNKKLESFSRKLIWLVVVIALPIFLLGFLEDRDLYLMIETAIALAVAAIPEGLPIVATISLAKGMLKLARHNVIVKKLAAVETLGGTNVILTDKTGTLTENKLDVDTICVSDRVMEIEWSESEKSLRIVPEEKSDKENIERLMEVSVLCNNAYYSEKSTTGDPLEVALLKLVEHYNKDLIHNFKRSTKIAEQPFDSDSKVMSTLHKKNNGYFVAAKGASEEILERCSHILTEGQLVSISKEDKKHWLERTDEIAKRGLKVLAFAYRDMQEKPDDWMSELVFIGLVGFLDPPREDVPESIEACKSAGIKVIMVTGDHPTTARTIAHKTNLVTDPEATVLNGSTIKPIETLSEEEKNKLEDCYIFSRVTPEQKLQLVQLYKEKGNTVAMTGDGVNDAPALKKADIGIAMGIRGTQVARETADMVLQDDAFPSIIRAIRQGRVIFNNIKNFIIYLMSCNLSEILVVTIAAFANLALPLQPLQILFLNIVTDVFPALALGMGKGNPSIMQHPPRDPSAALLNRKNWTSIIVYALVLTASVFSVFLYGIYYVGFSNEVCNNIAFLSLAFGQLFHPINLIGAKENFLKNDIIRNPHLWAAVVFCTVIIVSTYFIPYSKDILNLQTLNNQALLLIAIGSILPVVIIQPLKRLGILE